MFDFKYFKPFSVTWLASAAPLIAGTFQALTPVHGMTELNESISIATGGVAPAVLINLGLFGVGLRGSPGVSGALGKF